jgi:hypothetical protein
LDNKIAAAPTVAAVKAPVVAVLGCRKYEFDYIVAGAKAAGLPKIDFRFYDQDTSPTPFRADYAITLKFMNHGWDAQCKNGVPDGNYKFSNGGVSTAIKQLETWFRR